MDVLISEEVEIVELTDETASDVTTGDIQTEEEVKLTIGELCFPELYKPGEAGPNYDQFNPIIAKHCFGTNNQDIKGVKEVVFFGDSVTVGTPNLTHLLSVDNSHFYRNNLAEWLADHFNLDKGGIINWGLWKTYDYFSGKGGKMQSGDFRNCSKWGARTDDFLEGGKQVQECLPDGGWSEPTLFVFTMGGNDISSISQAGAGASPEEVAAGYPKAWSLAKSAIKYLEEAVKWLKDPAKFPAGSFVIFTNGFEFTDATGKTDSCSPQYKFDIPGIGEIDLSKYDIPVANLAGYGKWEKQEVQEQIVIWMLEQYMRVAVENGADMIWTLEKFCGHGYVATGPDADTENRCYLGPEAALWFDETCIHPSDSGHNALFEMFKAVVIE
ncbi:MAG: hypothetical protein FJ088_11310 [Deltaproteobacteria bacterium]|nr:hypothetical protein [Deltaproteobacteria bacterium]